jgi:hypothetical protein
MFAAPYVRVRGCRKPPLEVPRARKRQLLIQDGSQVISCLFKMAPRSSAVDSRWRPSRQLLIQDGGQVIRNKISWSLAWAVTK